MGGAHMLAVADEVERADLPIGPRAPAMRRREHLHPLRRAPEQRVEIPGDVAEIVAERRRAGVPGGEDETLVGLRPRRRHQAPFRLVHCGRQMLIVAGGDEPPVDRIAPAVIRADEMPGIAGLPPAQLGAPMAAGIEQDAHRPAAPPDHDHRHPAHGPHDIVALVRDFAVVGDEDPEPVKDPVELHAEHILAHEGLAAHRAVRRVDPGLAPRNVRHVIHVSSREISPRRAGSSPPASRRWPGNCIIAAKIVSDRVNANRRAPARSADSSPLRENGVLT